MRKKGICIASVAAVVVLLTGVAGAQEAKGWKQEIAVGYSQQTGNTQNKKLTGNYDGIRQTDKDELTLKASTLYSSQNKKMDGQKHTGLARFAPNLGDTAWFYFGKAEAEHDRFAGIDYRVLPSIGMGYWFSNTEARKAEADVGFGYEYTKYRDGSDAESMVLIPHAFYEQAVFENAKISQDLTWYPSLERADTYRVRSETRFTNALSESLALRVSFIDEFNSRPAGGNKKNDTQFILALAYAF